MNLKPLKFESKNSRSWPNRKSRNIDIVPCRCNLISYLRIVHSWWNVHIPNFSFNFLQRINKLLRESRTLPGLEGGPRFRNYMGNQTSHSSFIPECGSAQPVWEPVACCTSVLEASLPSGTAVEPQHCCFVQLACSALLRFGHPICCRHYNLLFRNQNLRLGHLQWCSWLQPPLSR